MTKITLYFTGRYRTYGIYRNVRTTGDIMYLVIDNTKKLVCYHSVNQTGPRIRSLLARGRVLDQSS